MQMAIPILILGQIVQAVGSINPKRINEPWGRTIAVFDFLLSCRFISVLMAVILIQDTVLK